MNASKRSVSFSNYSASSELASKIKSANRGRDTRHELALRRALWALGLRYRKNVKALPGKPDIAFTTKKVAVFCDGDFWHGRNWRRLKSQLLTRRNSTYWVAKISYNKSRDRRISRELRRNGWRVVRLWETEILGDPQACALRVLEALSQ